MTDAAVTGAFDEAQPVSARRNVWTLVRIAALIAIGALLVGAVRHRAAQAPLRVTHTVSLADFGLQVILPSPWNVKQEGSALGFEAVNPETGAALIGAVTVSDPPTPGLETIVDRIIERQRAQSGTVENISHGVVAIGLLDARSVKYSFLQSGQMVRARTVAVQRGPKTFTLTCIGGPAAQKSCDASVHSMTMPR